jgi:hypothetical protein
MSDKPKPLSAASSVTEGAAGLRGECAADIAIVVAALKRCDMNLHGYGKCGTLTGGGDWTCPQCAAIAAIKRLERLFLTPCPCEGLQEDCERLQGLLAAEYGRTQDLQAERDSLRAELAASQERERVLREALEPFAGMAERFFALAEGKPVVEDEDRVTCEYVWLEFRHVLKVRDLRRAARALTPDRPYTAPSPERPSTADEGLSISGQETEGNHNA